MFCSGCGQQLAAAQTFCAQCGRAAVPAVPPISGLEIENYQGKLKSLAVVWFIYGGLSLLFGFLGLAFLHSFLSGNFGQWMHSPPPPAWGMRMVLHFAWAFIVARVCICALVGWGLTEHTRWGRILAIVAGFLSLLKFPFGTALGIWTLVTLMGYRNASLYQQS